MTSIHPVLPFSWQAVLALTLASASCGSVWLPERPPQNEFVFEMSARIASSEAESVTLWLPAPQSDGDQELGPLITEHSGSGTPREEYFDRGNRLLTITGKPRPQRPLALAYRVSVRRYRVDRPTENRESGQLPSVSPWLDPPANASPDLVREEARLLTAGAEGTLAKARILFDHVIDSMHDRPPGPGGWGRGDLDWILARRSGDSMDFSGLLVALCQSLGIPASIEGGYLMPASSEREPSPYYWARFFVPGMGWIPVDPRGAFDDPERRDAYFGGIREQRLLLTRGRDLDLKPRQQGAARNSFLRPYAEADGVDVSDRIEYGIRFLPAER
ncbi:MAG: transglutaminase family protein [Planctomycetota bacterium]